MTPHIFLESWGPALLVVHALTAMALAGATGHVAVASVQRLRGRPAAVLRHFGIASALYLGCFVVGLLLYPHYRYHVRGLQLDRFEPWASNLFDIKENLAALLLPVGIALPAVDKVQPRLAAVLGLVLAAGLLTLLVSGLVVTNTRGIP